MGLLQENERGRGQGPFTSLKRKSTRMPTNSEVTSVDIFIRLVEAGLCKISNACQEKYGVNNLTAGESLALKKLEKDTNLIFKASDKGGNLVIMDHPKYLEMCGSILKDIETYEVLSGDPTKGFIDDLMYILNPARDKGLISQNEFSFLAPVTAVIPSFYALPKIHKGLTPLKGCPIVAGLDSLSQNIGVYIDKILRPFVLSLPSYVTDIAHLLGLLEDVAVEPHITLASIDVEALYSSIPHDLGVRAVDHFLKTRAVECLEHSNFVKHLLFTLTRNYFIFNGKYFRQLRGMAITFWVVQDTGVDMDIQGLSSCVDHLTARVQNIQDFVVQNPMLEPRIPIPDLFSGDRSRFLNFKNNCKLFLALKPRSSGDPAQKVKIIISLLRGDPQDWAFSLAPGDPALRDVDAFFLALGLLYDEPNSVDQAEKVLLALCQGQDEAEVYCQKFRKWSVLTQWNECALVAIFRKSLSEALKDVMVGFPTPAGLNESMFLAIQIDLRMRERKAVHHLAVFSEHRPEPMQCDRTLTRAERQEHRRRNGLCFYCGEFTHAISDCPKRTKRFARSVTIGTVQSKFLLSVTLICSLSSYSVMAFVDSGAALNLMDLEFARRCGFFLEPLQCPIPLRGIDATPLAKNKPQYWTRLTMCMAPAHQEDIRFLVLHNLHDVVVWGCHGYRSIFQCWIGNLCLCPAGVVRGYMVMFHCCQFRLPLLLKSLSFYQITGMYLKSQNPVPYLLIGIATVLLI
ncbi:unnamed protein product [Ranitomeya imitator]|uniref:CCHC-type domain-containing protein n=1 Tax=Ranitomeya imitator TaxID=111125 RepID=A0ABN9MDW1_9NEOB|nr:unnamed protein product [Ranitomeya imitator]